MNELVLLALSLCATTSTLAEVVKKHVFHGHPLDRERVRRLIAQAVATCEQIAEALGDNPEP